VYGGGFRRRVIGRDDSVQVAKECHLNIPSEREHAPAVSRRYAADKSPARAADPDDSGRETAEQSHKKPVAPGGHRPDPTGSSEFRRSDPAGGFRPIPRERGRLKSKIGQYRYMSLSVTTRPTPEF